MAWVGAAYAAQNILYFFCLQHISAVLYQLLSQTKIIFAAVLMRLLVGQRLSRRQRLAVGLLLAGATAGQLGEMGGVFAPFSGPSQRPRLVVAGAALTVLSAFLSTLPNAFYERLIKHKGKDESKWVLNVQIITWTILWVSAIKLLGAWLADPVAGSTAAASSVSAVGQLLHAVHGFTPLVWLIVLLKSLNCILVPLCLKYADNVMYGYVKPASTVLTCLVTSIVASSLPGALTLGAIFLVFSSLALYAKG